MLCVLIPQCGPAPQASTQPGGTASSAPSLAPMTAAAMSENPVRVRSRLLWLPAALAGWLFAQYAVLSVVVAAGLAPGPAAKIGGAIAAATDDVRYQGFATSSLAELAVQQVPLWSVLLGTVAVLALASSTSASARASLDPRIRLGDIPPGLFVGIAGQAAVTASYNLVGRFVELDVDGPARQLVSKGSGVGGVLAIFVLLALIAPMVEECFYRGVVQGSLVDVLGKAGGLVAAAALFAAIHFQLLQLPGLFVAGLLFGVLALRAGRLGPSIVAHMAFNGATIAWLVASG